MGASPKWKIYDAAGHYVASCKEPEAAACLMTLYGPGATIRWAHSWQSVVWQEGHDGTAGESYDHVAETCIARTRSTP